MEELKPCPFCGAKAFKWNTKYPADMYFDIDLNRFQLVVTKDFQGNSHNKITMEIYKR